MRSHTTACARRRQAIASPRATSVLGVVFLAAGAPYHDLVLLDRDLHGAVARPVLGVHRIVLDRGIEPQAVALLAVVEGSFQRGRPARPAARAAAAPPGAPRLGLFLLDFPRPPPGLGHRCPARRLPGPAG